MDQIRENHDRKLCKQHEYGSMEKSVRKSAVRAFRRNPYCGTSEEVKEVSKDEKEKDNKVNSKYI